MNYLKTLGAAVVAAVTFGNIATAETTWVMASGYPDDSFFTPLWRLWQRKPDVHAGQPAQCRREL